MKGLQSERLTAELTASSWDALVEIQSARLTRVISRAVLSMYSACM
jgi:hypothetical protein